MKMYKKYFAKHFSGYFYYFIHQTVKIRVFKHVMIGLM